MSRAGRGVGHFTRSVDHRHRTGGCSACRGAPSHHSYDGHATGAHQGLRGRLKRRRPSEPDPGNAGAGRLERSGRRKERRMAKHSGTGYDAIFVGGGVIGLASAWRAAERGARVCVLERDRPAAGATGVAAGMLAPVGEASWREEQLLSLNLESLRHWPGFAERLEAASGVETGFAASRRPARGTRPRRGRGASPSLRASPPARPAPPSGWRREPAAGSSRGSRPPSAAALVSRARPASIPGGWSLLCSVPWRQLVRPCTPVPM